ncbi:MAG: hypothetical protein KC800_25690 [Candidatus Eremiobacteraeota bacterium]|nr:hypothetical protein [Candidatus Eremiobacteraeota bacterium]
MKTKVMQDKKYRYDILLTVSGWALAIFVSFLYLNDNSTPIVVQNAPLPETTQVPVARTDRVDALLLEARILLSRNRPVETINRITTLWSVCHSTQQDVPEESHRIFAQAVSLLSRNKNSDGPLPRYQAPIEERSEPASDSTPEEKIGLIKPLKPEDPKKEPKLTIPSPAYPLAKSESKSSSRRSYPKARRNSNLPAPPPPVTREDGRRPPAFPPPPQQDGSSRLPAPPPPPESGQHPGPPGGPPSGPRAGGFPPPPPPPGVPGRNRDRDRDPLEAGTGGPPPGYYY